MHNVIEHASDVRLLLATSGSGSFGRPWPGRWLQAHSKKRLQQAPRKEFVPEFGCSYGCMVSGFHLPKNPRLLHQTSPRLSEACGGFAVPVSVGMVLGRSGFSLPGCIFQLFFRVKRDHTSSPPSHCNRADETPSRCSGSASHLMEAALKS